MSLTLTKSSNFEKMPAGTHPARCYQIIDIGTQKSEYKGEVTLLHRGILSFETPEEKMEDGKPFIVHQEYTLSLGEKAKLRQHLESWRGQPFSQEDLAGFDIGNLLGQPCLITVVHKTSNTGNQYAKIEGISKLVKGMSVPELTNTPLKWEMGQDESVLPNWIKNKIESSMEKKSSPENVTQTSTEAVIDPGVEQSLRDAGMLDEEGDRNPPADFDDDLPF